MDKEQLLKKWQKEEAIAHIRGWDFSHILGRYREEEDLPWSFDEIIKQYLKNNDRLLDMETGGGEFLLSLNHDPHLTAAIEGYKPNIKVCQDNLLPLGIDFRPAEGTDPLPFEDNAFDVITNRHGSYDIPELKRVLKPRGLFLTQQVGAENDLELIELLMGDATIQYPENYLDQAVKALTDHGFEILASGETYRPIEFYDVGALVWFARIIEWEFPGFSVEKCKDNLFKAQKILERDGKIAGSIHRYYLVAQKS